MDQGNDGANQVQAPSRTIRECATIAQKGDGVGCPGPGVLGIAVFALHTGWGCDRRVASASRALMRVPTWHVDAIPALLGHNPSAVGNAAPGRPTVVPTDVSELHQWRAW